MPIIRVKQRSDNFTPISNALVNDEDLSAETLGVLVYLVTKPANWNVMPSQLAKRFGCGRDRMYRIINELIAAGYVRREQGRSDGGFDGMNYSVSEEKSPLTENTDTANQCPGNPTQQKKEVTKDRVLEKEDGAAAPSLGLEPEPQPKQKSAEELAKKQLYADINEMFNGRGGGVATNLLKAQGGNIWQAMAALGAAKETGDPKSYIGAIIKKTQPYSPII